jgi:uncharacterized protein (DUF58 family)
VAFRPRPGLFAITPVVAFIMITALLVTMGWPAYSWWAVAILAAFAVASVRIEFLRARQLRSDERHFARPPDRPKD